jgi:riboflavin kinase
MDDIVLYIARRAGINEMKSSTRRMSVELGASQQTISRKLRELEAGGLIYRSSTPGGVTVRLTGNAISILKDEYSAMKELFESTRQINGKVLPGMGEGGYYIKVYAARFREQMGFRPFAGTLNIEVNPSQKDAFLLGMERLEIPEFNTPERTFGTVYCYRVKINGNIDGGLVVPVRARHPENVAELVAPFSLRQKLGLKDGDRIVVERRE